MADATIAALAGRQHGLVTIAQLYEAGLDRNAIARRVAAGRLHRVGRGVYAVGHLPTSREALWLAAVFEAGEGAALSHLAAAELRRVYRYRAPFIDVVVPRRRRVRTATRIHRTHLHPRDVTTLKNIPVTSMPRTLVDLSDILTAHQLTNVIHEAAFKGHFSLLATRDAIDRANGRHNLATLEYALTLYANGSAGTKSRHEDAFLSMLRDLPEPLVNTTIHGVEPDFHWPDHHLALEIDGPGHARPRTLREDALKQQILETAGYEVLRVPEDQLRHGVELVRTRVSRPARQ